MNKSEKNLEKKDLTLNTNNNRCTKNGLKYCNNLKTNMKFNELIYIQL